ncbi:MAG: efflux RND transporter periplasmic adaptor subunit [Cyclobacteriaceae bacterium]|nr:efflux RND transporter periplasmic adaptor subunit [Cyclobacteriaceae bacterium]
MNLPLSPAMMRSILKHIACLFPSRNLPASLRLRENSSASLYLFALFLLLSSCNKNQTPLEADISIPVSVEDVGTRSIEKFISATGTVYPTQEVELKAELQGDYHLLRNPRTGKTFVLGDFVEKGTPIINIEDNEYRNGIKLESQKLNLELAEQTLEKQKSLYEKGGVSQVDLKNAEVNFVNARYAYESALIQLAKMKVNAPFSGFIVDLPHNTRGIKVATGASLLKMMNYSQLFLEVSFPEKELGVIREDLLVRITNYTLPDDTIFGKITAISPAIDPETRTFKSALALDNGKLVFRPGMFVKAELVIARKDSVVVIPKDIILAKQRGNTVYIVERNAAVERIIETGLENDYEVEVVKGLAPNERLVVRGFETLTNHSKVTIIQ